MTNPDLRISGVRRLGDALGVNKTRAAELAKQSWFPSKAADGSWSTAEARKAFADFQAGKFASTASSSSSAPPHSGVDESLKCALETSTNPEEISRTLVQLVSRKAARGDLEVKDVLKLKMALEELRRTLAGHLDIAKAKGEVIQRDVAKAVIGQLGRRAIAVLERYEVQLAARVEAWFSDKAFHAMTSEERARAVRAWAVAQTHELRKLEADDVEKLVAAEVKEQSEASKG